MPEDSEKELERLSSMVPAAEEERRKQESVECPICHKKFGNRGALGMHIKARHPRWRKDITEEEREKTIKKQNKIKKAASRFNKKMREAKERGRILSMRPTKKHGPPTGRESRKEEKKKTAPSSFNFSTKVKNLFSKEEKTSEKYTPEKVEKVAEGGEPPTTGSSGSPGGKRQVECPVPGCNKKFGSPGEIQRHITNTSDSGHRKYFIMKNMMDKADTRDKKSKIWNLYTKQKMPGNNMSVKEFAEAAENILQGGTSSVTDQSSEKPGSSGNRGGTPGRGPSSPTIVGSSSGEGLEDFNVSDTSQRMSTGGETPTQQRTGSFKGPNYQEYKNIIDRINNPQLSKKMTERFRYYHNEEGDSEEEAASKVLREFGFNQPSGGSGGRRTPRIISGSERQGQRNQPGQQQRNPQTQGAGGTPPGGNRGGTPGRGGGGDQGDKGEGPRKCPICGEKKKLEPYVLPDGRATAICRDCIKKLEKQKEKGVSNKITGKKKTKIFHSALFKIGIASAIALAILMLFGTALGTILLSAGIICVSVESLFGPKGSGGYAKAVFRTMGFILVGVGFYMHFHTVPILKVVPIIVLAFELVTYPMPENVSSEKDKGLQIMRTLLGIVLVFVMFLTFRQLMATSQYLFWSIILMSAAFFVAVPVAHFEGEKFQNIFEKGGQAFAKGVNKTFGEKLKKGGKHFFIKLAIWLFIIAIVTKFVIPFLGIPVGWKFAPLQNTMQFFGILSNPMGLLDFSFGIIIGTIIFLAGAAHTARHPNDLNGAILGLLGGSGVVCGSLALAGTMFAYIFFLIIATIGIIAAAPVVNARPLVGVPIIFMVLIASTAAYPDVMGESVFGVWWPKVDYAVESIAGPISKGIQGPIGTFRKGFNILSNPIGYYQNYRPQTSTKQSVGAVEVSRVEPMTDSSITRPDQKLMSLATVENQGKEPARNITFRPIQPRYTQGTDAGKSAGTAKVRCGKNYQSSCNIDLLLPDELREYALKYKAGGYFIRGNYIQYGAKVTYGYNVNGKVEVSVMDKDFYYKKAENDELNKEEQVTEDSGGPLRLGIAVMKNEMPVRDDMGGIPVMIYLKNEGPGTVTDIKSAYIDISNLEGEGKKVLCTAGNVDQGADKEKNLEGVAGEKIKSGKSIKGYCFSKIPDINTDQKTYQLTGRVDYTYTSSKTRRMDVDFSALYRCECKKGDKTKYIMVGEKNCESCKSKSLCSELFDGYSYNQCLGKQD